MTTPAAQSAVSATSPEQIDLGIAVTAGAFDHTAPPHAAPTGRELIWFMGRLFQALGRLGTALAIDFDSYYAAVEPSPSQEQVLRPFRLSDGEDSIGLMRATEA